MTSNIGYKQYITPDNPAGVLFPSFINYNYGKYYLPEIEIDDKKDPCAKAFDKNAYIKITKYQEFVQQFMRYDSPYRGILVYHGLGTGKTRTSIEIYNLLYNFSDKWNVFVLLPKALIDTWKNEMDQYVTKDKNFANRKQNFVFINYDSPYANKQFLKIVKDKYQNRKKSLFFIDEAHNFISNVLSNIQTKKRRAWDIYDEIMRHKKNNKYARVICLSATPAINQPFELSLLFNLLRENSLPNKENEFNFLFQNEMTNPILKPESKNLFQRRIMGLVSYYAGATRDKYATQINININLKMPPYQNDIYNIIESVEQQRDKFSEKIKRYGKKINYMSASAMNNMYRVQTRLACNIVFPRINNKINAETRPRPKQFRISEGELERLIANKQEANEIFDKKKFSRKLLHDYENALESYMKTIEKYWINMKDDLFDQDIKNIINIGVDKLESFFFDNKIKSKLLNSLYQSSPKITHIVFQIIASPGPVEVFSNFYKMEGIQSIKMYLKIFGFNLYKKENKKQFSFLEYSGRLDNQQREQNRRVFNQDVNFKGDIIKVILISPVGTQGISLQNVRQVHILEPYWHEVRIKQVIGRAIRQCSHRHWALKDRNVKVFRYFMVRSDNKESADQFVDYVSKRKDNLINSFLLAMKEVAIDCELFKNTNKIVDKEYSCFKFDNDILLSKNLGYVFRKRIENEQITEGRGSNSSYYDSVSTQVHKIKYVLQSSDTQHKKTSGWFDLQNGYVYDYKLKYLIGQVRFDDDGIPEMFDESTYLIGHQVPLDKYNLTNASDLSS